MKWWGFGLTVFGVLALIGSILGGTGSAGSLFWIALGLFLMHKASEKKKEKEAEKTHNDSESNEP